MLISAVYYYQDNIISCEFPIGKKLHRVDGPAVEHADGHKEWHVDGRLHRIDGPAIEYVYGTKAWYVNGKRHRIDGPAVEHASGHKEWWIDGKHHRVDGPAIEWTSGEMQWWIDNYFYTKQDFNKLIKEVNEMSLAMKLTDPRWWVRELGEKELG
jgi:hypothetical protein